MLPLPGILTLFGSLISTRTTWRRGCRLRGGAASQAVFAVRENRKRGGREADARHSLDQAVSLSPIHCCRSAVLFSENKGRFTRAMAS